MTGQPEKVTLIGKKSEEEIKAELLKAQEANAEAEAKLGASLDRIEQKEREVLTGKDIPFDPKTFITKGIIRKENIQILNDLIIDMETITQQRRAFAEKMVKAHMGETVEDNSYKTVFDTALLAMAVTRMNNREFPAPDMLNLLAPDSAKAVEGKAELFKLLLNSTQEMASTLTAIYNNLESADALVAEKEPVIKK